MNEDHHVPEENETETEQQIMLDLHNDLQATKDRMEQYADREYVEKAFREFIEGIEQ